MHARAITYPSSHAEEKAALTVQCTAVPAYRRPVTSSLTAKRRCTVSPNADSCVYTRGGPLACRFGTSEIHPTSLLFRRVIPRSNSCALPSRAQDRPRDYLQETDRPSPSHASASQHLCCRHTIESHAGDASDHSGATVAPVTRTASPSSNIGVRVGYSHPIRSQCPRWPSG